MIVAVHPARKILSIGEFGSSCTRFFEVKLGVIILLRNWVRHICEYSNSHEIYQSDDEPSPFFNRLSLFGALRLAEAIVQSAA